VGEIAAASREQAQGIDQINQAINHMDQATQNNAATAEEAAASSEEMNGQAELLQTLVVDLMSLVGGGDSRGEQLQAGSIAAPKQRRPTVKRTQPARKAVKTPDLIPMNDKFRDF
jgi:methyl-accepting chemotaxis protein